MKQRVRKQGLLAAQGEKDPHTGPRREGSGVSHHPVPCCMLPSTAREDAPRLLPFEHLQEFSGSLLLHLNKASKTLPEQVLAENMGPGA